MNEFGSPDDGGRGQTIWEALRREAALTSEHLGIGATAIGRAHYERTATYAQAFFALSVGLERSAKLVLTLDAAQTDGAFLDGPSLRRFGHRLDQMLDEVEAVALRHGLKIERPDEPIHRAIVSVLTDFANNVTRYYNLEVLASPVRTARDPIAAWHTDVAEPVLARHYSAHRQRADAARVAAITLPAEAMVWVIATSETGERIKTLQAVALRQARATAGRPWERMYVLQLARYVTAVIGALGTRAQAGGLPVPYLEEFYRSFQLDDHDFRSRKIWSLE